MLLSLCVVHYFSEDHLERFLKSIEHHSPSGNFEIIIIDNGGSKSLKNRFGSVKWISSEKNIGFGAALNRAARESTGEFIFLGNCDLLAKGSSFDTLLECLKTHPKAGIVGPKLVFGNADIQDSARSFPTLWSLIRHRCGFREALPEKASPVDWLVGAALLIRRDLFLKLGGFDERFFLFFEDTDLCRRVKAAGYEVWYCPEAVFTHTKKRLSESDWPLLWLFKTTFWIHVKSAIKYFWKWRKITADSHS